MKIYFGHSRMTYNTDEEKEAIKFLQWLMPEATIVNPNIPEHQEGCWVSIKGKKTPGREIGYFLDLAEPCDIGCFLQYYEGKWSAGSATEVNRMFADGKRVFQINLKEQRLDAIEQSVEAFTFEETLDKLVDSGIRDYL
jgi:hypothetical protein